MTPVLVFDIETIPDVAGLRAAFEEAVDDYIDACAKIGKTPEKPASGKLMLRVPPEVHSAALIAALASGVSLQQQQQP